MKTNEYKNIVTVALNCDVMRAFDDVLNIDEIKRTIQAAADRREFSFVFNQTSRTYLRYELRQHFDEYDLDDMLIEYGVTNYAKVWDLGIARVVEYYIEVPAGGDFRWQAFMCAARILEHMSNELTALELANVELIKFQIVMLQTEVSNETN